MKTSKSPLQYLKIIQTILTSMPQITHMSNGKIEKCAQNNTMRIASTIIVRKHFLYEFLRYPNGWELGE